MTPHDIATYRYACLRALQRLPHDPIADVCDAYLASLAPDHPLHQYRPTHYGFVGAETTMREMPK